MAKKIKGLFDYEERQQKISKYKDPLQTLKRYIDWEAFRPGIESCFKVNDPSKGGRPPYDKILLFKIIMLQHYYNLSEEQVEFQIADRFSFMHFLDLELHNEIPDSNTMRGFREALTESGTLDNLFVEFGHRLEKAGFIGKEGRIVDATFVAAPRQRNSRGENEQIKQGKVPEEWSEKKKAHKDVEADWTKKNNEVHFGYKNHVIVDSKSKLIVNFQTTPASVHDGNVLSELIELEPNDITLYGDSAYSGEEKEEIIRKKDIKNQIHEKGRRNHPLTTEQKQSNREKSRIRARVEHPFAWMHRNCVQIMVKTIGISRATAKITLLNLLYNMTRGIHLLQSGGKVVSML